MKIARIYILLFFLCFTVNGYAYFEKKNGFGVYRDLELLDKEYNGYTASFCCEASQYAYDADFSNPRGRNYLFLQENGFEYIHADQYTLYEHNEVVDPVEDMIKTELLGKPYVIDVQATIAIKKIGKKKLVLVSFRGTNIDGEDKKQDLLTDILAKPQQVKIAGKDMKVHSGFWLSEIAFESKFASIKIKLKGENEITFIDFLKKAAKNNDCQFLITGHSLGGAIATLFAARLVGDFGIKPDKIVVYTYGAPAVGKEVFREVFDEKLTYFYRIRHQYDIIPVLTSKTFVKNIGTILDILKSIPKKNIFYRALRVFLNGKENKIREWYYFHIGQMYLLSENRSLHYQYWDLKQYRLDINKETVKKLFNIDNHSLDKTYAPILRQYIVSKDFLESKRFEGYGIVKSPKNPELRKGDIEFEREPVLTGIIKKDNIHIVRNKIFGKNYYYYDDGVRIYAYPDNDLKNHYGWLIDYYDSVKEMRSTYYNYDLYYDDQDYFSFQQECSVDLNANQRCPFDFKFLLPLLNYNIVYDLKERKRIKRILTFINSYWYIANLVDAGIPIFGKIEVSRLYYLIYQYIRNGELKLPKRYLNDVNTFNFYLTFGEGYLTYFNASKLLAMLHFYKVKTQDGECPMSSIFINCYEPSSYKEAKQYLKANKLSFTKKPDYVEDTAVNGVDTLKFFQRLYKILK